MTTLSQSGMSFKPGSRTNLPNELSESRDELLYPKYLKFPEYAESS
ncbi:MAG TPA: hypothetical protein PKC91_10230 [Ignavibacteria bacterium]|nr:hypothetical protein [Ignavibacteria bacterium]